MTFVEPQQSKGSTDDLRASKVYENRKPQPTLLRSQQSTEHLLYGALHEPKLNKILRGSIQTTWDYSEPYSADQ